MAAGHDPLAIQQFQVRPADRTCVGLRVEAAVRRIVILAIAIGAHCKFGHRCERPVVWHIGDDGVSRPHFVDAGKGRGIGSKTAQKTVDIRSRPLDLNRHARAGIQNEPIQLERPGEVIHERTESNPLYRAANLDDLSDQVRLSA